MTRLNLDEWGLGLAELTARRGTCLRRQVGCVLLSERGHVLSTGYNGVAAGQPHCNEEGEPLDGTFVDGPWYPNACPAAFAFSGTNLDGCHALHAEQNALLQCRDVWQIWTCCVTTSPCMTCTKLLLNTSCQRVVFREAYPHTEAEALWTAAGREWLKA